jgi:hypothetical protein
MSTVITERLDKIAGFLESKGFVKEAYEIDVLSDAIEKVGVGPQAPQQQAPQQQAPLNYSQTVEKAMGEIGAKVKELSDRVTAIYRNTTNDLIKKELQKIHQYLKNTEFSRKAIIDTAKTTTGS